MWTLWWSPLPGRRWVFLRTGVDTSSGHLLRSSTYLHAAELDANGASMTIAEWLLQAKGCSALRAYACSKYCFLCRGTRSGGCLFSALSQALRLSQARRHG